MKSFKIGIVLLVSIVSLLYSCQKDDKLGEFLLSDEMKAQNPYQKGDSLILISNSGDTISGYVYSKYAQISQYYYDHTMVYYLVEIEYTSITLRKVSEKIGSFYCQMGGVFDENDMWRIYIKIGEKSNEFLLQVPFSKEYTPYIDSLYVRNRWVGDVFVLESVSKSTLMYYSTQYGIVKIDFSDGSFWELESIHWAERE